MTPEKDKKDKWANRDINVVEWASIPKFSTLDDIVTPLRLLELFFDPVLVDMIFGYNKLYSHREKADISFGITNEKIRLFLSMLLLNRSHELSDCDNLTNKTNSRSFFR